MRLIGLVVDPVLAHALAAAASLVLLLGAAAKLRDWSMFRAAVEGYRLLRAPLVTPAAMALPALEAIAGFALLFADTRAAGIVLAFVLLATVTAGVIVNLVRGRTNIDCGCGGVEGRQRLSWALVARNAVLMLAVLACLHEGPPRAWVWIDYATLAVATIALYVLYACASQLVANRPNLADLESRA